MEAIRLTTQEAIIYVTLLNAAVGFFLGLIPLGFGIFKGKPRLGILGIAASTIGGALLGVFLSIPAMAICTWLIVRDSHVQRDDIPDPANIDANSENDHDR
ncbi:hypothetical protein [Leptolyngbya sp. 7M]|uniref:hypothetical protein n=1 Tax=Leptolyngbya sp. 7M TaxID=2812896 RepID=UPI001B8D1BC5|nr:hypothetical protein [Leptolyngbya sp. 7M]QYO65695.1 hypothetical protein JVX88_02585 [Leptolyngbya sp. 7M]